MKITEELQSATLAEIAEASQLLVANDAGEVKKISYGNLLTKLQGDLGVASVASGEFTLVGTTINLAAWTVSTGTQQINTNTTYTVSGSLSGLGGNVYYFIAKNTHATNTLSVSVTGTNNVYFPGGSLFYCPPSKSMLVSFLIAMNKVIVTSCEEI